MVLGHTIQIDANGVFKNDLKILSNHGNLELSEFIRSVYKERQAKYSKFYKMDNFCKLGYLTSEFLMNEVGEEIPGYRIGIFLFNASSSTDTDMNYIHTYKSDIQSIPSPSLFVYTLPNILIGEISIRHGVRGEHSFFLQEGFASEFLYLYVKMLFDTHRIDGCIVGHCEYMDNNGHSKLGWLRRSPKPDEIETLDYETFKDWITYDE